MSEQLKVTKTTVSSTKNYNQFLTMKGNREIDDNHVQALVKSMQKQYIPIPIQVNEHMEVIDGQHRLAACRQLAIPVHYVIVNGGTIETVKALNTNTKNWTALDFVDCYAKMGNKEYINLKAFMNEYDFSIAVALLVSGNNSGGAQGKIINNGTFRFKDINKTYELANQIKKIKPLYHGYKRRNFILALINCLRKEYFNIDEFISKLLLQPVKLMDCATTEQYISVIEEIYNYKRQEKVNLRFANN